MIATIRSEFTKIITQRSVWIVTCVLIILGLVFQLVSLRNNAEMLATLDANGMHWLYDRPVNAVLDVIHGMRAIILNPGIFFVILGAVIAGSEFSTGQLGISTLAIPSRIRFVIGKTLATLLYTLILGGIYVIMTLLFTYISTQDLQSNLIWTTQAFTQLAGGVLFILFVTLMAFCLTLITRRTLHGIVIMGIAIVITFSQLLASFLPLVDSLTPISAARNYFLQTGIESLDIGGPPFSSTREFGGIVLLVWFALTFLLAIYFVRRRDAR